MVIDMFVISVKSSKLKAVAAAALAVVLVTLGAVYFVSKSENRPAVKQNGISLKASTEEERIAFFSQFGWQVDEEAVEVKEVVIPEEFDETYQKYNEVQELQGLDLEKYKGTRVKFRSYKITNYPGLENSDNIRGNILIYDGCVIGGDVSSVELNGFMHTFYMPEESEPTTSRQTVSQQ